MIRDYWAKWIMVITTLFAPFGVYAFSVRNSILTVSIHAMLWGIMPDSSGDTELILFGTYIIIGRGLFYGIFNIWFGIEVIRYFNDYSRRRMAIRLGILSLVYPFAMAIISLPWLLHSTTFEYLGPIPIQFVVGLLLMKYFGEQKPLGPWSD
ncbi:MAG: hypothetical protein JW779_13810 [Candidatus Thorarchaeota archaeon]|nr:hypothetical protein [Candidatus Thorarchaeota archaeon]